MCVFLGAFAQENTLRFGWLSYEAALTSMPQYAVVKKQMEDLRAQYQAETKRAEDEFNRKYEEFLEGQRDFPKTILQKRQTELQELMEKNIAFKEESLQQLAKAEAEAMEPLKARLNEVIAEIASRHQLALVINTDANACPFIDPAMGMNLDELVISRLKHE
jgi:outer membrane protein